MAIDDESLRRARLRASANGTSVNALLREYLSSYRGDHEMSERLAFLGTRSPISRDAPVVRKLANAGDGTRPAD